MLYKRVFYSNSPFTYFSKFWLSIVLVGSFVGCFWSPYNPKTTSNTDILRGISFSHLFGTDNTGRDIFSVVLRGCPIMLIIIGFCVILSVSVGLILAILASRPGIISRYISLIIDVLIAIPLVLVAIILAVSIGSSLWVVVISCSLSYSVSLARILRPEIVKVMNSDYSYNAYSMGASTFTMYFRHIIPNVLPLILTQISVISSNAILAESGLSFLGYGVNLDIPSWGNALSSGVGLVQIAPLCAIIPGLIITITCFSLYGVFYNVKYASS